VLPTSWQAVEYASVPEGGRVAVLGLGPIGDMACRVAAHRGAGSVIGVDRVPERLDRARRYGIDVLDLEQFGGDAHEVVTAIRDLTDGRGPDSVIDAVGMEAHGSPVGKLGHRMTAMLPDKMAAKMMERVGIDRMAALLMAIELVRRGGIVSIAGVYGGMTDPLPMLTMFDKQIHLRMGQANVRRWVDELLPLVVDGDPLGVETFATHHLPLAEAPDAYAMFQKKEDGAVKVLFRP
jgi:threonine dehydrogenase-like Zn-dependent dehydrogenase